ncbi:hypothetical protein [Streptomyces sp. NBC_00620]|uniref:hypothetical protein n=1 Tax=Streptomyces sp. NBC_00620 TaxID=2903666 RepID=UPI00224EF7F3|nr:hypothetical protein [Streptomyces sp. NBC_00620]MCX4974084.1 hypothetical protein [Streptomyces sp. NBC_00620]
MTVEFDVGAELAAVADEAGVRRFIEGFARHWREPIGAGDGCSFEELTDTEWRLGTPLPIALWDAYGLLGKRTDLTSVQDQLLSLEQLRIEDGALVFRRENQSVAEWAVRREDLETDDPPVVFRRMDSNARDWSGFLDRFSLACIEMVLSESLVAYDGTRADNRPVEEPETFEAPRGFERLALPDYPMWAVEGGTVRWFASPDVLLRVDAGDWLWALGRTAPALDAVRELLPGDWINRPS